MKCEICGENEGSISVWINPFWKDFCIECMLSYNCQIYRWNNKKIETYIDWRFKW